MYINLWICDFSSVDYLVETTPFWKNKFRQDNNNTKFKAFMDVAKYIIQSPHYIKLDYPGLVRYEYAQLRKNLICANVCFIASETYNYSKTCFKRPLKN